MGTNYYWETSGGKICPTCRRGDEPERLHIGKSSAGWAFSLHAIPERNLNSLADWQSLWGAGRGQIRNEYGDAISMPEMMETITDRAHPSGLRVHEDGKTRIIGAREPTWFMNHGEYC